MSSLGCLSTEPSACRYVARLFLYVGFLSGVMDTCRLLRGFDNLLVGVFAPMVLRSLALRDVVTLYVGSVFILVHSGGLTVFCWSFIFG